MERDKDEPIRVHGSMIRLGQLLKLADWAENGSQAREIVSQGRVRVNGSPVSQRGLQLHDGDIVELDSRRVHVETGPPPIGLD